ncbi:7TM diverse intracellular signaling domain-containing protein [Mucilaginibacter puniceus]
MNKIIRLLIIAFLCCAQQFARAQKVVNFDGYFKVIGGSLEILTDTNSNIPLSAAIASKKYVKTKTDFPNLLTTNYSYWIRFKLQNNSINTALGVQIAQAIIDYVDFYQVTDGKVVQSNSSGHRRPFYNRIVNHQSFIYPVNVAPRQSTLIYLHVKSGKQLILPIYAGTFSQVFEHALKKDITFGIYIGIILVMVLYNLFVYYSVRDRNYLYYVAYLSVVLLAQSSIEGYLFRFIIPEYPALADNLIYITTALIGFAAIEFCKSFLDTKHYTPIMHKITYVFYIGYIIQIVFALCGEYNISYTIMEPTAMFSALFVLAMAIVILRKGSRSAKFFLIAWSFFIFCVVIYGLKDFNVLPYNSLTDSALLIGSAFEAVMLSFALADRINVFKAEKEKSQEETVAALQENERIIREQNVVLEQKVEERTLELSETNHELNTTLEDLKQTQSQLVESEKMASLGQLTAGIAHEINNPINFVTSNVNPLKRDVEMVLDALTKIEEISVSDIPAAEKQKQIQDYKEELDFDYLTLEIKHLIKGINEGANRTAEIVKGLKIFSRLDEDDLKKADMNEGLESTMIIANNLLNNKIQVTTEYDPELPLIECYAGKLNQVFLNIVSNAVYAIQKQFGDNPGGELLIKTHHDEDNVYVTIKDNGTGMDEQTQKKIFEPFFTTKEVGEGTGLGMSITYNTIKKHDGQIIVNSKVGEGTEFILQLPIIFNLKAT